MEVLRGKLGHEEGLREALEIITGYKSVNSGVLEIKAPGIGGKMGIAWGRFITGALLDSGETGKLALRKLLVLKDGSFTFLDTEGEPVVELRQSLGVDLNGVVPYVPDDIKKGVTSWLFEQGEADIEPRACLPEANPPPKLSLPEKIAAPEQPASPATLVEMLQLEALRASLGDEREAEQEGGMRELRQAAEQGLADQAVLGDDSAPAEALPAQADLSAAAWPPAQDESEALRQPQVVIPLPEEPPRLDGALVQQARKQAAAFLNKETRAATHLRLVSVGEGEEAIAPEGPLLASEPFAGLPSLDYSGVPAAPDVLSRQLPAGPPPTAYARDNQAAADATITNSADGEGWTAHWCGQAPAEHVVDCAPDVVSEDAAADIGQPSLFDAAAQSYAPPLSRRFAPPPPAAQAHNFQPPPSGAAATVPVQPPDLMASDVPALPANEISLLDQLVSNARKPVPAPVPVPVPVAPVATSAETPMLSARDTARNLRKTGAERLAGSLKQNSSSDSLGIAIFCVLFFVVSCAGTIVFGPRVLATINTVLHSTH